MVQQQGAGVVPKGNKKTFTAQKSQPPKQLENQFVRTTETLKPGKAWHISLCSIPSWARYPQDHTQVQLFTRMTQNSEKLLYLWLFVACDIERTQTQIYKRKWYIEQSLGKNQI